MAVISFKPKQVTKKLLATLADRARDILTKRFGLDGDSAMTLEAIGNEYNITRERVRQIENFAIASIKKSSVFEDTGVVFDELMDLIVSMGGVVTEDELLSHISNNKNIQNHIHLLLVLGGAFKRQKEDSEFKHRWIVDEDVEEKVCEALKKLYSSLSNDDLVSEPDLVAQFLEHLKDVSDKYRNEEIAKRWLTISKKIDKNPLGEYGIATSPNVHARGMRDYAFLVIRRHGNPMHFGEVASEIEKVFNKKAHVATCHNELIKDPRFVLVGRGLYALDDWGYASGIVRDVIKDVLKKENTALTKQEIIDRVLKERYVKTNTIIVNLQNGKHFKKDKEGKYAIA